MSTLSRSEKQALNELFVCLQERKNFFQRVKNFKKEIITLFKYILKSKKAKNPFI